MITRKYFDTTSFVTKNIYFASSPGVRNSSTMKLPSPWTIHIFGSTLIYFEIICSNRRERYTKLGYSFKWGLNPGDHVLFLPVNSVNVTKSGDIYISHINYFPTHWNEIDNYTPHI